MDTDLTLDEAMAELVSAEDFLDFFAIEYQPAVVQVNRLHILQRFHDYLARNADGFPTDEAGRRAAYRQWLQQAYDDFVYSDALTEKVFKVFHTTPLAGGGSSTFVPLEQVFR